MASRESVRRFDKGIKSLNRRVSGYVRRFHNVAVIVLAAGQADVMGPFQFTAFGAFFVDRGPKPVVGAALIAA